MAVTSPLRDIFDQFNVVLQSAIISWKRTSGTPAFSNTRPSRPQSLYSRANRRRSELPMTETELKLIAAAAMIGLSNRPKAG
jgi:hypothetical protein